MSSDGFWWEVLWSICRVFARFCSILMIAFQAFMFILQWFSCVLWWFSKGFVLIFQAVFDDPGCVFL